MTSVDGLTLTALNRALEEALIPDRCECTCQRFGGCEAPTWLALSPCNHETAAFCAYCKDLAVREIGARRRATGMCRVCGDVAPLDRTRWEPIR